MKAISITAYGEPGGPRAAGAARAGPGPRRGEHLRVALGRRAVDAIIRRGEPAEYDYAPKPPLVPLLEVAGIVRAVGPVVDRFAVGDGVATLTLPGASTTVHQHTCGAKAFRHPVAGEFTLTYELLGVLDDADQFLTLYTAEPGTDSAATVRRLSEASFVDS